MLHQVTRAPGTGPSRTALQTGLRAVAVAGLTLLAACQTGTAEPADVPVTTEVSPSATGSAAPAPEPSRTPEPSVEPDPQAAAGPVVNGPNTITTPTQGEVLAGPSVTVAGEGTAFEANLSYRVLATGTDEVVLQGNTSGGANGEVDPFSFTVDPGAGNWTIQVWEAGMADGEGELGPYLNLVEVDVTVQ